MFPLLRGSRNLRGIDLFKVSSDKLALLAGISKLGREPSTDINLLFTTELTRKFAETSLK